MRLLQVTGTLDPAFGGPPVVLNQLTRALVEAGHAVDVLTLDAPGAPWLADCGGDVRPLGPSYGRYSYCRGLTPWVGSHAYDYDAVIVHGIWQYQSLAVRTAARSSGVPYFVFVHGALDPWFQSHYPRKHLKKALYWRLVESRVLRDARAVLFTCEEERRLARLSFRPYDAREAVATIGIEEPDGDALVQRSAFLDSHGHLRDKRIMLFLSRIHPKKGCDLLIRAFARVSTRDEKLHLVMAGPDDDGWKAELIALAESLDVSNRITWTGMIVGDVKWGAYRAADVFVLTSHSENFGLVVPEALACGLPVLITNKVNIWREIAGAGAGLVAGDTVGEATTMLDRWLALPRSEADRMRQCARACFVDQFELHSAASGFVDLMRRELGRVGAG